MARAKRRKLKKTDSPEREREHRFSISEMKEKYTEDANEK